MAAPVDVVGIMTHFATADEQEGENAAFMAEQLVRFRAAAAALRPRVPQQPGADLRPLALELGHVPEPVDPGRPAVRVVPQLLGLEEVGDGVWSIYLCHVLLARVDERDYVLRP